jgi:hypothetical protein
MKRLFLFALLSAPLFAQPAIPDCLIQIFQATATGVSASFDNRGFVCQDWTVTIFFQGFSAASAELDSAPDNNGVAGVFAVFNAGTTVSGTNPNTVFTQKAASFTVTGYFPWLRLNVTSLTGSGTITVTAFGFRPIAFTLPKTTTQTANITQIGGNAVTSCNAQALFNFSTSGNVQLVALSGTNRILICHYDVVFASAVDFKLTYGTGSNCASGTTDLTGLKKSILADAEDYSTFSPLIVPAGNALCGNESANVAGGFTIIYAQIP